MTKQTVEIERGFSRFLPPLTDDDVAGGFRTWDSFAVDVAEDSKSVKWSLVLGWIESNYSDCSMRTSATTLVVVVPMVPSHWSTWPKVKSMCWDDDSSLDIYPFPLSNERTYNEHHADTNVSE